MFFFNPHTQVQVLLVCTITAVCSEAWKILSGFKVRRILNSAMIWRETHWFGLLAVGDQAKHWGRLIKVNSIAVLKWALSRDDFCRSGVLVEHNLNPLGTRWWRIVSFTSLLLYHWECDPPPGIIYVGGSVGPIGGLEVGNSTPAIQPITLSVYWRVQT
jgi:hypothetical protein